MCFSAAPKLAAPRKRSRAAFCHLPSRNPKHWDFACIQEGILIEDIFNFFFPPPAAFEDDAIAVPVSAAAAADHHWYVLASGRRSGDKLINVDAPGSQYNPAAGYVGIYRCVKNDYPEGPAGKGF